MSESPTKYLAGGLVVGAAVGFATAMCFRRQPSSAVAAMTTATSTCGVAERATSRVRRVNNTFDPSWKPGQKQPPPFAMDDVVSMTPDELVGKYRFFISAVVPRPIQFVSSVSSEGVVNLSPFSYSGLMCHDPATVVFSVVDKNRGGGDTLKNVRATREFVTHMMSEWFVESANHTCGNFDSSINEFEEAGLTQVESELVKPPRCAEAALALECRVDQLLDIMKEDGSGPQCTMVIGRVVKIHVNRAVYDEVNGVIDPEAFRPVARMGGNTYTALGDLFDLARPSGDSRKGGEGK